MSEHRNYGVDLLRIVLMICIIIGHLYAHTEIRNVLPFLCGKWLFTWGTQAVTVCAVNCFVIVTGYYMSQSHYDLYKIVKLWFNVVFYSVFITILLLVLGKISISMGVILDAVFPVLRYEYWFFTMYLLLFLLSPFINVALYNMTKKMHKALVIIILLVFYTEPLLSAVFYEYDQTNGFSIIAFLALYVIGAYLKKCEDLKVKKCVLMIIGSSFFMVISKIVLQIIVDHFELEFGTGLLYHNNSIFVLINAVAMFELFKQVKLNVVFQKIVAWISPSVFSVYLLHEKPIMRELIWNERLLIVLNDSSFISYCLVVFGISIGVFIIGIVVDKTFSWIVFKRIEKTKFARKLREYCKRYNSTLN